MRNILLGAMYLLLATLAGAQSTVTETLGVGTPSTQCIYQGTCIAPVIEPDGTPNGIIEIHASAGVLHRYGLDGTTLWDSADYVQATGAFTHDGLPGRLSYTLASKSVRCGGSGRWIYTCVYRWVASGSLTE